MLDPIWHYITNSGFVPHNMRGTARSDKIGGYIVFIQPAFV